MKKYTFILNEGNKSWEETYVLERHIDPKEFIDSLIKDYIEEEFLIYGYTSNRKCIAYTWVSSIE